MLSRSVEQEELRLRLSEVGFAANAGKGGRAPCPGRLLSRVGFWVVFASGGLLSTAVVRCPVG